MNENIINSLFEAYLEFIEVAIHQLLYCRKIYPLQIFESRRKYHMTVSQCRHPDINKYIKKVLYEASNLLRNGLIKRICMLIRSSEGEKIEILSIECNFKFLQQNIPWTDDHYESLEDEFRSTLLSLCLSDDKLKNLPVNVRWDLVLETFPVNDIQSTSTIDHALTSGQWFCDNLEANSQVESIESRVIGFKSFQNDILDLKIYAQTFTK